MLTLLAQVDHVTSFAVEPDVVLRLGVAAVLGAAIGFEREATEQPAGLRTHIALAIGAALFGVISAYGFDEYLDATDTTFSIDPTRVASNVATGIGFLGAGVIFRRGSVIQNLTTAASLWAVGAIGLQAGLGDLGTAAVATAMLLASLVMLRPVRTAVRRRLGEGRTMLRITLAEGVDPTEVRRRLDADAEVDLEHVRVLKEAGHLVLHCTVQGTADAVDAWRWAIAPDPQLVSIDDS